MLLAQDKSMDNEHTKQLVHLDATTPLYELLSSNYIWSKDFFLDNMNTVNM